MTWYVEVQDLDYDDYPVGNGQKIGPFESKGDAEAFLENSPFFSKYTVVVGYSEWKYNTRYGNHTVRIKNLLNTRMTNPDRFF